MNMSVTVIPAVTVIPQVTPAPRKLRCSFYARVSSLHELQISSNENQALHFQTMLANDPDIIALPGYIDTGISGTQLKNRIAFNQMMEDARAGKIDRIYTKSLSRWARNTLDSIKTTRELRDLGVEVIFEKENLSNMDSKSEVIFSLLSSIAQAESQSIAGNISGGIHYNFQQGKQMINCSRFLGYSKDPLTKQLVIEPSEAATVRYIYRAFLEGLEPEIIAKRLREAKVPSAIGQTDWPVVSVRYILTNERYKGCALLQKTMVKDMPLLDTRNSRDLTGTLIADIVLQLLSYVAETERAFIHARQAEGIAAAKARGVKFGHPGKAKPVGFEQMVEAWRRGEISAREAGRRLGVPHCTFLHWARGESWRRG